MSAPNPSMSTRTSINSRTRTPSGSSSTGGNTKSFPRPTGASADTPTGAERKTGLNTARRKI